MEDIFISNLQINKVRHLENLEIPLSETDRKHLILTGKNGSGKTSVLEAIKDNLKSVEKNHINLISEWKQRLKEVKKRRNEIVHIPGTHPSYGELLILNNEIDFLESKLTGYQNIELKIVSEKNIKGSYHRGDFILAHFNAKRTTQLQTPKGIANIELPQIFNLEDRANTNFIQYIVNLKAERSFARDEGDEEAVRKIDRWFENFEKSLRFIFEDESLQLKFDRKHYNFEIVSANGEKEFNFNTLSEGYSAIMNIVTELILRMEQKVTETYDIQGIVLIDEVDAHLHIALQKKILPFLISFFPKIQFIVTTHSPFVLNSVKNAVVYDLEKQFVVEEDQLEGISYEGIVESYFDVDKYSDKVKEKISQYENLSKKKELTEEEKEQLFDLKLYFKELPKMFSPELTSKIRQIQLSSLGRDKSA